MMKTFNEYKPKVEEHTHFFKLPSFAGNLKTYVFLLLLLALFLGSAIYIPSKKIKEIEHAYSVFADEINKNIQERDRLGDDIATMLKDIGYEEKNINAFLNDLNYKKMVNVVSLDKANKDFEQATIDFQHAYEVVKNSNYHFITRIEDIPADTAEGKEFLNAINTPKPPNLRSKFLKENLSNEGLETYKNSVEERKKAVEVHSKVKDVFDKEKEKQAKIEAKRLEQEIKKETTTKARTKDKAINDLLKTLPAKKEQPIVKPKEQPKTKPQSDIPSW